MNWTKRSCNRARTTSARNRMRAAFSCSSINSTSRRPPTVAKIISKSKTVASVVSSWTTSKVTLSLSLFITRKREIDGFHAISWRRLHGRWRSYSDAVPHDASEKVPVELYHVAHQLRLPGHAVHQIGLEVKRNFRISAVSCFQITGPDYSRPETMRLCYPQVESQNLSAGSRIPKIPNRNGPCVQLFVQSHGHWRTGLLWKPWRP